MASRMLEPIDERLGLVRDIMERSVVSLSPDQPLGEALRQLESAGVSGAPVIEDGRLVGMVSVTDLYRAVGIDARCVATSGPWLRFERLLDRSRRTVGYGMATHVICVSPDAPVSEAARLMRDAGVNRIPVIGPGDEVIGIVARDDVINAVARMGGGHRPATPTHAVTSTTSRPRIVPG